jgi:hypothetical protein
MVSHTDQIPRIFTAAEADLQRAEAKARQPDIRTNRSSQGSSGPIAYIVAALILIVVGYLLFSNNWNTMSMFPTVAETVPSPDVNSSIAPVPVPPLAPQTATSPANPPVTP